MKISRNDRLWAAMVELGFERSRFAKPLQREHGGFALGDSFAEDKLLSHRRLLAADEIGNPVFLLSDRPTTSEIVERFLYYWRDQLALIAFNYSGDYGGGWQRLVDNTVQRYGPPSSENSQKAVWNDGYSVFILARKLSASISASLGDLVFLLRHFDLNLAPTSDRRTEFTDQPENFTLKRVNFPAQDYRF